MHWDSTPQPILNFKFWRERFWPWKNNRKSILFNESRITWRFGQTGEGFCGLTTEQGGVQLRYLFSKALKSDKLGFVIIVWLVSQIKVGTPLLCMTNI